MNAEDEARAAWERAAWEAHQRAQSDHVADVTFDRVRAERRHAESQNDINNRPQRLYSMIVAADLHGAFSKDGQIPWYYKEDFSWFQRRTTGHICVMGRTTYDDINNRLGEKAATSVLPNRQCFVVTSSPLPRNNATVIARLADLDKHLPVDDVSKTVFFCGGERIYSEGISYCHQLLITMVNKEVDGDKFIPREHIMKYFEVSQVFEDQNAPDLRFINYRRKAVP